MTDIEPTPEQEIESLILRHAKGLIGIRETVNLAFAAGERRQRKRDAEIVREFRTKHPLYLSEIAAAILAEGA